ncbi:hypothetical protein AKJ56_00520 [candidate division MSBL1 archaeon SCGC-AAA382N08]|uniref:Uncharacterized protein n=1 Tax=candidate division MSBL1 archaeon SCGC-AAA382N08 TaxID=1698285 RepID=A0A133VQQ6_9EURY|nr:hypothetical protein AKJ56_00520 [candidate division MSBL1 archaeon SCGC-AAA382N08]
MKKGRIISGAFGGILGLYSLFQPYIRLSGSILGRVIANEEYTLFNLLNLLNELEQDSTGLYIVIGLVITGSIIAFIHPSGGLLQLSGWILFGYGVTSEGFAVRILLGLAELNTEFYQGFYLILIASIITLAGFASTGLSYSK